MENEALFAAEGSIEGLGAILGIIFLIFLVFVIIMYVIFAFFLMKIAEKTNTEKPWMAWIPFVNFILIAKMADKPWWWGLIMIFSIIIPFIGSIVFIILYIYLFWLICEKLNKPGPLSLLMLIPIANFILMGYLAFSK